MYGIKYDKRYEFWKVTGTSDPINNRQYKTAQGAWTWIAQEYAAMHKRALREVRRCAGKFIAEEDSYSASEILTDYQNEFIAGGDEELQRFENARLEEFENGEPEAIIDICEDWLSFHADDENCAREQAGDYAEKKGYPREYGEVKLAHEIKTIKELLAGVKI